MIHCEGVKQLVDIEIDGNTITATDGDGPPPDVAYLASAPILIDVMEREVDVVTALARGCHGTTVHGRHVVLARGLAHYVSRHHVGLPRDFLAHVAGQDYTLKTRTERELLRATQRIMAVWAQKQ